MARRTLTIKRIDPWSVLKVGFLANLVLLGILLLAGRVVWFFIERLELIGKACEVATSVGFQDCGLNGGNIFRNAMLLGMLGVVVQTGILVFVAFLHNLISELTGGLSVTVVDDLPERVAPAGSAARSAVRPGPAPSPNQAVRPAAAGAAPTAVQRPTSSSPQPQPQPQPRPAGGQPTPPQPRPTGEQPSAPRPAGQQPSPPQPRPAGPIGDPAPAARPSSGEDLFGGTPRPHQDPSRPHGPSRP